jgi:hypothetical protein
MNLLEKLLVAVTAMGVLVTVQAEVVSQVQNSHSSAPTDYGSDFTTGGSTGYSFADIVNLPTGGDDPLLSPATSVHVAGMTLADISNVADSTSAQSEDANTNTTGSLLGAVSTLNGAVDDVSGVVDPDDLSKSRSGTSGWHTDAGFLFSIAEVPEPADWMTLLCGLVVVAFMARRKNGPFAD